MQLPGVEWIDGGHTEARVFVFRFDTDLFRRARWPSQKIRRCTPSGLVALGTPQIDQGSVVACFGQEVRSSTAHGMLRSLLKAFGLDPRAATDPEALDVVHLQRWGLLGTAERAERALEEMEASEDCADEVRYAVALCGEVPEVCELPAPEDFGYLQEQLRVQVARATALEHLRERYAREVVTWHFGAPPKLRAYKKPKMPLERRVEFVRLLDPRADLLAFARHYRYLAELNGACFVGKNFRASLLSAFQMFKGANTSPVLTESEETQLRKILSGTETVSCPVCGAPSRTGDDVCSDACADELCGACFSVLERRSIAASPYLLLEQARRREAELARLRYELSLQDSLECVSFSSRDKCARGCRLDYVDVCCDRCLTELGRCHDIEDARRRFRKTPGVRQQLEAKLQRLLEAADEASPQFVEVKTCGKCRLEEREDKRRHVTSRRGSALGNA